jgi:hypothetical protein
MKTLAAIAEGALLAIAFGAMVTMISLTVLAFILTIANS